MRLTLFWYMIVSPFVEFPDLVRVTPGGALRVGPAPKCRSSAFTEGPDKSFRCTCRIRFRGKPLPAGWRSRSRRASCCRAPVAPDAVTEQTTGSNTVDTSQTRDLLCASVEEVCRGCSYLRSIKSYAKTVHSSVPVNRRKAFVRLRHSARARWGQYGRIGRKVRHRSLWYWSCCSRRRRWHE